MTSESMDVAAELDKYQEWARKKMRDSFMRLAEAYAATGARESRRARLDPKPEQPMPDNVIVLAGRRSG